MSSAIQYQGRKARRAGSEQRRQAILEAALNIIVKDGIRAVRHRAVAREADVPLSATTYYFKDISDLIADTFTLFAERALKEVIEPFKQQAFALLSQFSRDSLADADERQRLIDMMGKMMAAFTEGAAVPGVATTDGEAPAANGEHEHDHAVSLA